MILVKDGELVESFNQQMNKGKTHMSDKENMLGHENCLQERDPAWQEANQIMKANSVLLAAH